MSYAVKEMFLTLQGEGMQAGRRAVFLRFAGCNLWTGREQDRATAQCNFCDTDFVGMDGENGGRYEADALAARVDALWGGGERRLVVITGGEPLLAFAPDRRDVRRELVGAGELAAAGAVGADKVGVAEIALRARPVLLAPRPQVAAGEAQEHRAAPRLHPLALQREETFLHRIGHA